MSEQATLGNLSFAEAEKKDLLNSKFFSPEVNTEYRLSFKGKYALFEKQIPNMNDKSKMDNVVVLHLELEQLNGDSVEMTWDVMSKKLRNILRQYCEDGSYLEYTFRFKKTGTGKDTQYFFTPDLKSKKGAAAPAAQSPISSQTGQVKAATSLSLGETVEMVTVWVETVPGGFEFAECVGEDGKTYKVRRGNVDVPKGLAEALQFRGFAKIMS